MRGRLARTGRTLWWRLLLLAGLMVPPVVQYHFEPAATAVVVRTVLADPWINGFSLLMVAAKYLLLTVSVACLARPELVRWLWAYYAVVLVVIGIGQNVAVTDTYGFVWLVGNTVVQVIVAAFAAVAALRRPSSENARVTQPTASAEEAQGSRWWVLVPMALAWLFPYQVVAGEVRPGLPSAAWLNESGATFCMVTPVVLGVLVCRRLEVGVAALAVTAWVGLLFGLLNVTLWFALDPASWWMGVLHLPLLVLSWVAMRQARGG